MDTHHQVKKRWGTSNVLWVRYKWPLWMRLNLSMLLITMHIQVYRREKIPVQMLIAFIDKMFYKGNKSEVQSASSRLYLSICFDPQSFMYHKPCQCYYVKVDQNFWGRLDFICATRKKLPKNIDQPRNVNSHWTQHSTSFNDNTIQNIY